MRVKITRLKETGFCYGVQRAIELLEKSAAEQGTVDCYGELVHNPRVMQKLKEKGIHVIESLDEIKSPAVAISAHGVSPAVEADLAARSNPLIDATCPSVKKVQKAAQRFARAGHCVVIFGDARHSEVKGILGWAEGKGLAALDPETLFSGQPWPSKIGILSQTTQVPENYLNFVKILLDKALAGSSEITVLNTICQGVRRRQSLSLELAADSDLMLVVGGKNSANTRRLAELCGSLTETHLIENSSEIEPGWLKNKERIGVASGTSTSSESIDQVIEALQKLTDQATLNC